MKFEPLGDPVDSIVWQKAKEAPQSPTMKNLPKQNPPLEIITLCGAPEDVTSGRLSKAELGLPANTVSPGGSVHSQQNRPA